MSYFEIPTALSSSRGGQSRELLHATVPLDKSSITNAFKKE
jgi:hypothetical protein